MVVGFRQSPVLGTALSHKLKKPGQTGMGNGFTLHPFTSDKRPQDTASARNDICLTPQPYAVT
jgi:hypothetical protein